MLEQNEQVPGGLPVFGQDDANDRCAEATPPTQDMAEPSRGTRGSLPQGATLAARYRIVRVLGRGGMGSVYEAADEARGGSHVAVKVLDVHQPQALYRLKNEFRALAETVHPNLVRLHQLAADAGDWFVVMDLIDPSNDFLRHVRGPDNAGFDEGRLRSALTQLMHGVSAIHAAGKVHRDLKPSNVLVTPEGRVVIVDFGLVGEREEGGVGRTQEGWFAGTPGYAAPEQALGRELGPKADLYALGALLFEALTGRLPIIDTSIQRLFERKQRESAPDPRSLAHTAPADLCALCLALLRPDPAQRPDLEEILTQIERAPIAPAALSSPPFVGRERELARLQEAAGRLARGAPVLALVSGASGIGKTTLMAHFLERMRAEAGAVILRGRCHAQEQVPYNAFDLLIDGLGRHLARLNPVTAASLMPRDVALVARLFPTLARVRAVVQMPWSGNQALDPSLLRPRAFAALKELLARIADRGPLIVCFDDLQWADDDSNELLRELLRGPDAPASLFLCAFRRAQSSEAPAASALRRAAPGPSIELSLEPLGPDASATLARALLAGGVSSDAELGLVVRESAGSPFLIRELAHGARMRGRVGDLRESVAAISAELAPDARRLLQLVCVAGRPLSLDVAVRAARVDPQALADALSSSLLRMSTRSGHQYIESSHDRIGDAVLELIDAARRAELHTDLARYLAQDAQQDPELIAQHYRAAGFDERAAPYTVRAAERAREALAFSRAAELYELAFAEAGKAERGALELSLAETYTSAGRLSDAAERYLSIALRCEQPAQRRSLTAKAMQLHALSGYPQRGTPLADALCRELGVRPLPRSAVLAFLLQVWLWLRYLLGPRIRALPAPAQGGHEALARERLEFMLRASRAFFHCSPQHSRYFGIQALVSARRYRDARSWPLLLAVDALWRGTYRGAPRETEQQDMQRAVALAEAEGDPETLALVLTASGGYDLLTCQPQSALHAFERAERVLTTCGPVIHDLIGARSARMATWSYFGHYKELLRHADAWVAQAEAMGEVLAALASRIIASHRFLALDDVAKARAALADFDSEGARATFLSADPRWIAEAALYEADPRAALAACEQARRSRFFRSAMLMSAHRTLCWHLQVRAHVMAAQQGQPGAHLRAAQRHAQKLEREQYAVGPAAAAQTRGSLAMLRGDRAQALTELTRAAELHARAGTLLHAAAARHHIGLLQGGDAGRAQTKAALSEAAALGVRSPEHWFRSLVPGFSD
jgi:hypothetical protein